MTESKGSRLLELLGAPSSQFEYMLIRGEPPSLDALAGWEYLGMNTPRWAKYAGIQKFIKGFFRTSSDKVAGYNIEVVQNGPGGPWKTKPTDSPPKRFGFYSVEPVDATASDNEYLNAVLLDYSRGENSVLSPTRVLRDYLVRVDSGSDALLLGKAYVALGNLRVPASYFILERYRPQN